MKPEERKDFSYEGPEIIYTFWAKHGPCQITGCGHRMGVRSGKPCIRGLRITVTDVLEYLAAGMTVDELVADFPDLTADDIRACLAFAADRERKLCLVPPG